jgi:hypothetical protein
MHSFNKIPQAQACASSNINCIILLQDVYFSHIYCKATSTSKRGNEPLDAIKERYYLYSMEMLSITNQTNKKPKPFTGRHSNFIHLALKCHSVPEVPKES